MFLGSWFNVSSGRLEIRYKIGVKVVIQGPAVFAVDAADGGFLRLGNLLVCVEPGEGAARAAALGEVPQGGAAGLEHRPHVRFAYRTGG